MILESIRRKISCPGLGAMFVAVTDSQAKDHIREDLSQPHLPSDRYHEHWKEWLKTIKGILRSMRMIVMVVVSTPCPGQRPCL